MTVSSQQDAVHHHSSNSAGNPNKTQPSMHAEWKNDVKSPIAKKEACQVYTDIATDLTHNYIKVPLDCFESQDLHLENNRQSGKTQAYLCGLYRFSWKAPWILQLLPLWFICSSAYCTEWDTNGCTHFYTNGSQFGLYLARAAGTAKELACRFRGRRTQRW